MPRTINPNSSNQITLSDFLVQGLEETKSALEAVWGLSPFKNPVTFYSLLDKDISDILFQFFLDSRAKNPIVGLAEIKLMLIWPEPIVIRAYFYKSPVEDEDFPYCNAEIESTKKTFVTHGLDKEYALLKKAHLANEIAFHGKSLFSQDIDIMFSCGNLSVDGSHSSMRTFLCWILSQTKESIRSLKN